MANLRDIRRRIKSVKNTRQITRAMQLVSSSKMKRAQDAAVAGRPYAFLLADLLDTVAEKMDLADATLEHPFFEKRQTQTRGILLLSTDKGLCGPMNANLFRKVAEEVKGEARFITVGRKAMQFVSRSRRDLAADFTISDKATFRELRQMLKFLLDLPVRRDRHRGGRVSELRQRAGAGTGRPAAPSHPRPRRSA